MAPNSKNKRFSRKGAFFVHPPLEVEPMFMFPFILNTVFTPEDLVALQQSLGEQLPRSVVSDMNYAASRLLAVAVYGKQLPSWSQLRERLERICEVGKLCIKHANEFARLTHPATMDNTVGAMSADATVKAYLISLAKEDELKVDISRILKACDTALKIVTSRASHSGPKPKYALSLFLEALFNALERAGIKTTLPSNEMKGRVGTGRATRFFQFSRIALSLAVDKGVQLLPTLPLTDGEKDHVKKTLRTYGSLSDGGLLERLRAAKKMKIRPGQK